MERWNKRYGRWAKKHHRCGLITTAKPQAFSPFSLLFEQALSALLSVRFAPLTEQLLAFLGGPNHKRVVIVTIDLRNSWMRRSGVTVVGDEEHDSMA